MAEFAINPKPQSADEELRDEGLTPFAFPPMTRSDSTARFDLETLQRIIGDEAAREAARRGEPVAPHDPIVRERVCALLLRQADRLRSGGAATVFTELAAVEDESPHPQWLEHHAAA